MRRSPIFLLLPLAFAGCAVAPTDDELAADLWAEIDGYEEWALPEGWTETPTLSDSHMGAYVVAYLNDTLAGWDGSDTAPDGSISVKQAYDDDAGTTLTGLTVMKKIAGYDEATSDWFWASYSSDGAVGSAGKVEMCSDCHASAPADYVYAVAPAGE